MDLADAHAEILEELHWTLIQVMEAELMAPRGDEFDTLCSHFEALALCHLQEFADVDQFRLNLVRAGQARRHFLRRCRSEGATNVRHLARSRTNAFFAALAAGVLPLAREIVTESTHAWNPQWEYEDDFAHVEFLHVLTANPTPSPRAELAPLLAQFERALEGDASPRLDVDKALFDGDAEAFADAMESFLEAEERVRAEEKETVGLKEEGVLYWPRAQLSIEGLSLLKAGELVSLSIPRELPLCPNLARLPWTGTPISGHL